jgi:hypothetical protein
MVTVTGTLNNIEMNYYPDYWQVVSVQEKGKKPVYKVFATFVGGYTEGDVWRLNSGIVGVTRVTTENTDRLHFAGESGSQYACPLNEGCYRTNLFSESILRRLVEDAKDIGVEVKVLPFDTDFERLDYESSN